MSCILNLQNIYTKCKGSFTFIYEMNENKNFFPREK